jgi:sensor domain CHASE-containing protein
MKLSLGNQFRLLFALLICALLGGIIIVSQLVLLQDFIDLEEKQVTKDTLTAAKIIQDNINELNRISLDWSIWDDTYQFLDDQNQDYIDSNLAYESFESIKVNWMIYVLNDGSVSYSKGYDLQTTSIPWLMIISLQESSC